MSLTAYSATSSTGFVKVVTHLLKHIDDIIQSLLNGNGHDVIYLDFAKAFDKVDHEILTRKLRLCGVQGKLLKWIEQFLTNKKQFVAINGFHSMLALVLSGVPQGSVLGPILFLVYINDLRCHLKGFTAGSFADDTRLNKQISSCDDVLILQEDLKSVVKWATENNMVLHDSKFEYLAYITASWRIPVSFLRNSASFPSGFTTTLHRAKIPYTSEQCQRSRCSPQPRHERVFSSSKCK